MPAVEPDYKEIIPPIKMRRMNKIVRMGIAASASCLNSSAILMPDAIITATGWGCLSDTYKFLDEMAVKKEETLSPATFIQSTHNTVGGQIALFFECQEYNNVFVNHTLSFEYGLMDSLMLIAEGKKNILIGGIDEIAEADFELKRKSDYWKNIPVENTALFKNDSTGTIAGEGATFFLLTEEPTPQCITYINGVIFTSIMKLSDILKSNHGLNLSDFDLVLSGFNGDIRIRKHYDNFMDFNFQNTPHCYYKHLCGEYDTASAFGLWIANEIIKTQKLPDYMFIDDIEKKPKKIDRILIHNYSEPDTHACILVSKAGI